MLFSRAGSYPAGRRAPRLGRLLAQHRGRRLPRVPGTRPHPPHQRGAARPRSLAVHPRGRDRRLAGCLAGQEPPRRARHARIRRGPALARARPRSDRDWILFTDEQPVVTVHPVREAGRIQRPYQGTYFSARRYVMKTFAESKSQTPAGQGRAVPDGRRLPGLRRARGCDPRRSPSPSRAVRSPNSSALPLTALAELLRDRGRRRRPPTPLTADLLSRIGPVHRTRPRLSEPGPHRAHPLGGRAPAPAARHPAALRALRRGVRPGRAVGGSAPGRHRGAAHGPRPAEGGGQLGVRGRAPSGRGAHTRTGSSTWVRWPASTAAGCCTAGPWPGSPASRSRRPAASSSTAPPRRAAPSASRAAGWN